MSTRYCLILFQQFEHYYITDFFIDSDWNEYTKSNNYTTLIKKLNNATHIIFS